MVKQNLSMDIEKMTQLIGRKVFFYFTVSYFAVSMLFNW